MNMLAMKNAIVASGAAPGCREHCAYCDRRIFAAGTPEVIADPYVQRTRDHIIPSMMGSHALNADNTVWVCRGCNDIKGSYPFEVFDFFRRNFTRGNIGQRRLAMHQFVYNLARVGLIACFREAARETQVTYSSPMKARGSYTRRDLRRSK